MKLKHLLTPLAVALLFASCQKGTFTPQIVDPTPLSATSNLTSRTLAVTQTFDETFESATKTAYADANVTFTSGSWDLNSALVGTSTSDAKTGTHAIRIENTGTIGMNFDVTTGASTVTLSYAVFGSDGSSAFQLWESSNGGSTYTQVGTGSVTASATTLATATFTVNQAGTLRFQLRKTTGGSNRIDIDNFTINSFDNGSGGGTGGSTGDNSNLLMGNPSGATTSITNFNNYLYDHTYYVESYNRTKGEPNWVSWYVGATTLGTQDRANDFRNDPNLPTGWYEVGSTSYSGSGFDRGHNCPSGDRTTTVAANEETFLMDNMIPQAPQNNEQTWAHFEEYGRTLVTAGNEVYVIMGSYGSGGTGSSGTATTINGGNVVVPSNIWKVMVVIPNGNNDLSRITASTRVIAINTPNINTTSSDWTQYITTVKAIETATGYTLLSALPTAVRTALETKKDAGI